MMLTFSRRTPSAQEFLLCKRMMRRWPCYKSPCGKCTTKLPTWSALYLVSRCMFSTKKPAAKKQRSWERVDAADDDAPSETLLKLQRELADRGRLAQEKSGNRGGRWRSKTSTAGRGCTSSTHTSWARRRSRGAHLCQTRVLGLTREGLLAESIIALSL